MSFVASSVTRWLKWWLGCPALHFRCKIQKRDLKNLKHFFSHYLFTCSEYLLLFPGGLYRQHVPFIRDPHSVKAPISSFWLLASIKLLTVPLEDLFEAELLIFEVIINLSCQVCIPLVWGGGTSISGPWAWQPAGSPGRTSCPGDSSAAPAQLASGIRSYSSPGTIILHLRTGSAHTPLQVVGTIILY